MELSTEGQGVKVLHEWETWRRVNERMGQALLVERVRVTDQREGTVVWTRPWSSELKDWISLLMKDCLLATEGPWRSVLESEALKSWAVFVFPSEGYLYMRVTFRSGAPWTMCLVSCTNPVIVGLNINTRNQYRFSYYLFSCAASINTRNLCTSTVSSSRV